MRGEPAPLRKNDFRERDRKSGLGKEKGCAMMQDHFVAQTADVMDILTIGGRTFRSRLLLGTGKYRSFEEMRASLEASGSEIITVALRRLDLSQPQQKGLLDYIDPERYTILPNTAGCKTAEDAVQTARLAAAMGLPRWVKLEVIPDPRYLLPDPIATLEATRVLVKEGFDVLPYINADPVLARHLQDAGAATVMPLGSPIGSGQGLLNLAQIQIIIEQASVPVVVDAGIGAPSDAALAMELAVEAGRIAFFAGRIPRQNSASASSPTTGVPVLAKHASA
jgi:thiazole synthase